MDLGLQGKVAVITGSSTGIGFAIARELAAEGVATVLCARGAERLDRACRTIVEAGGVATAVCADVATPEGAQAVVRTAADRFGGLDILVNNAGGGGGPSGFLALRDEDWLRAFHRNLMSAVWCSRAAVPLMRQRGGGRIVNIASTSGREPDIAVPHYAAAKAGLINLSKSLANTFAPDRILVNCVCPGLTRTEAVEQAARERLREQGDPGDTLDPADAVARYFGPRRPLPLGIGTPEDVSGLVVFLCSARARWITGACFDVDGGWVKSML